MSDRMEFYVPGQPFDGGTYHYVESGLDNVFIKNGFSIEEDDEYGRLVSFHNSEDLHKAIGLHLMNFDNLSPKEFKFLRKQLRCTQASLASECGVDAQTIANYEKGTTPIPKTTDYFLRAQFILSILPKDMRAGFLQEIMRSSTQTERKKRAVSARDRNKIVKSWRESEPTPAHC